MSRLIGALALSLAASCASHPFPQPVTQVAMIGVIHSGHRSSEVYSLEVLEQMIRDYQPEVVLTEIPPDRLDEAAAQFASTGEITESRVRVFPEYTDVLFPLQAELGFEIEACAGWTAEMAAARREQIRAWQTERPEETARVNAAQATIDERLQSLGDPDDPRVIHTIEYDEYVREGMRPYDELWNDELGDGGWTNINQAHWDLIDAALDKHAGKRVVITYGAWHKYWFLDRLRERDDVELLPVPMKTAD